MRTPLLLPLLSSLLFLSSCGGEDNNPAEATISTDSEIAAAPEIVVTKDTFGVDGNLWKPKADPKGSTPNNVVVLFSAKYTERFDNCEIALKDGSTAQLYCQDNVPWTHVPYSCFANGNRQTWRTDFKCSSPSEVKVTCRLRGAEYEFSAPDGATGWTCNRFG